MDNQETINRLKLKLQYIMAEFNFNQTEGSKISARIEKETYETAIEALENQVPIKGEIIRGFQVCPICKYHAKHNYCPNCGQKIDWS